MKSLKKALLGTALAGTLVVGASYGTYSWFTAEKTTTGTIQNGTLGLGELNPLFEHSNFAPSQLLLSDFQTIEKDDANSLDQVLRATYSHNVDKDVNVGKYKVGYFAIKYKQVDDGFLEGLGVKDTLTRLLDDPSTNLAKTMAKSNNSKYEVVQGVLSDEQVQTIMKAQGEGEKNSRVITLGDGDKQKFWNLKDDEKISIVFGVKLSEKAGNNFQGAKYEATFKVEGKQTDQGALYQSEIGEDTAE